MLLLLLIVDVTLSNVADGVERLLALKRSVAGVTG
jgi:hypothetical protein